MRDKIDLVEMLYERSLLNDDEEIILSDGFESALIGITAGEKIAVYDFWKAICRKLLLLNLLLIQSHKVTLPK